MCAGPFEAETPGVLPGDGPVSVGGVELPAGHVELDGRLWITDQEVPSAYVVWADLAAAFGETGLWPVLWTLPELDRLKEPAKPAPADGAEALLRGEWEAFVDSMGEDLDEFIGPLPATFPGLVATQQDCRYNALDRARTVTLSSMIALVPVRRPADVPVTVGWNDTDLDSPRDVSVILRSWEDRLGAYLGGLARGGMFLYTERPPQTDDERWIWAVEQVAFNNSGALPETLAEYVTIATKFDDGAGFYWD